MLTIDDKVKRFLAYLTKYGCASAARAFAGMTLFDYEKHLRNESFRQLVTEADKEFCSSILRQAVIRGRDGYDEVLTYQGAVVYRTAENGEYLRDENGDLVPETVRKHSDKLLSQLLQHFVFNRDNSATAFFPKEVEISFIEPPKE